MILILLKNSVMFPKLRNMKSQKRTILKDQVHVHELHGCVSFDHICFLVVLSDSVRIFKEKMKLMQQNQSRPEEEEKKGKEEELAKSITVGQRCLVSIKKDLPKRGTVMFVGKYIN